MLPRPRPVGPFIHRARPLRPFAFVGLLVLALALTACEMPTASRGVTPAVTGAVPTATATTAPTATATTPAGPYPVKVFFSKHPESDSDVNAVFPVDRSSPTLGVARFAMEQLIKGPTATEKGKGYYTDLTGSLSGSSNCGGADFQLYPDHKGPSKSAPGTMTIQFCRQITLAGDLTGFRIAAEINKTLGQFSNVKSVVILNRDGGCFNDFKGTNDCLK